jgi:large subunit ribosomal protein L6
MSRVGKLPVTVPAGVDVSIKDARSASRALAVFALTLNALVTVVSDAGKLSFARQ